MRVRSQRGFVLMVMAACMFLLLAVIGMAFDLGRVYIARNEAQVFTDAAAMTACAQLDGTASGLDRARAAVARLPIRWNLGSQDFRGVAVEFRSKGGQWEKDPKDASAVRYARVTTADNNLEITFLRAVGGPESLTVAAHAVAQVNPVRLVE